MAMIYNLPRLFDTQSTYQSHKFVQRIGNTGDAAKDFRIIVVSIVLFDIIAILHSLILFLAVNFLSHVNLYFDEIASVYCSYTLHK